MGRSKGDKRRDRKQGFNRPELRPISNYVSRGLNARRGEKRQLYNELSMIMVIGAAVTVAVLGYTLVGWFGAFVGFIIGGGLMSRFVVNERFYR